MQECQITNELIAIGSNGSKIINIYEMVPNKLGKVQSKSYVENLGNNVSHKASHIYVCEKSWMSKHRQTLLTREDLSPSWLWEQT